MNQTELQQHVANGTLAQAAEQLKGEFDAAQQRDDAGASAQAANDLGIVYLMQNDTGSAREYLDRAQALFIRAEDTAGQGRATGNLGQLEERAGNGEAAALYMQAADLLHEGGAFQDEYTTRRRLSKYYLTHGATLLSLGETVKALRVKPNASAWDKFQIWFYSIPLSLMGIQV